MQFRPGQRYLDRWRKFDPLPGLFWQCRLLYAGMLRTKALGERDSSVYTGAILPGHDGSAVSACADIPIVSHRNSCDDHIVFLPPVHHPACRGLKGESEGTAVRAAVKERSAVSAKLHVTERPSDGVKCVDFFIK